MKKLVYILSLFVAVLLLDSCSKENVTPTLDNDPFAIDVTDDNRSREVIGHGDGSDDLVGGGVIDNDNDDDDEDADKDDGADDNGGVIDNDNDDDDEDADKDETAVDDREEGDEGM